MLNESVDIDLIGGDVDIDNFIVLEFDIIYFFQDQWVVEFILGVMLYDVVVVDIVVGDVDLGDVVLLLLMLMVQYYFNFEGVVCFYVGVGVNFIYFFDESLLSGSVLMMIDYDNSFGFVVQVGIDFDMGNDWFFNVDVKYIEINIDVMIDGVIMVDVDIDLIVVGLGFGCCF